MQMREALKLIPGQRVDYLGTDVEVMCVRKNGVTIGYWATGLKEGQFVTHRVTSRYLEPREV
jgi:hypothetical protein